MPFPIFLVLFLLFLLYFQYKTRSVRKNIEKERKSYWDREATANFTRRKSLNDLAYLTLELDTLPIDTCSDHKEIQEIQNKLRSMATRPLVDLRGYSNTDLKLTYGSANLELLSDYETNYSTCLRLLYQWGSALYEAEAYQDAIKVLEYGLTLNTDLSEHYILLGELYKKRGHEVQIKSLIEKAEKLDGLLKNKIIRTLKELL